ncbi:MAG: hypothetical protein HY784_12020, partial [Chloroflexi bacterium]|nr:hypothetical protein [Chloroflexota bacterium]
MRRSLAACRKLADSISELRPLSATPQFELPPEKLTGRDLRALFAEALQAGVSDPARGLALAWVAAAEAERHPRGDFRRYGRCTLGRALLRAEVWDQAQSTLEQARAAWSEA